MKTGILTFQDTNNFGSLLQTFALYKVIKDNFGECEIIDYKCSEIENRELPKTINQLRSLKDVYRYIRYNRCLKQKYQALTRFSKENMKFSPSLRRANIYDYAIVYDQIIVGSDIVWDLDITGDDYSYFLDFFDNKKYSYASSFGSDYLLKDERKEKVGNLLSNFVHMSVREKDACEIIKKISGCESELVVDPTLLLDIKGWKPYIASRHIKEKYLLIYFEDTNGVVASVAKRIGRELGLPIYNITNGKKIVGVHNIPVYKVEDFLSYLYYADYIVTASYHGMAFSINFNKDFNYFNRCHKSRMETLAYISGLGSREFTSDLNNIECCNIDFSKVNNSILYWKDLSFNYLKEIFKND